MHILWILWLLQSISDVCTAGAACVPEVLYTAHHIPGTRSIWAFSTGDPPSTRSITMILEYRNTLSTCSPQSIEPKHALDEVCTESSLHYPQIDIVKY